MSPNSIRIGTTIASLREKSQSIQVISSYYT
jgi:hypothetical protein